jgi:hypothetical protein
MNDQSAKQYLSRPGRLLAEEAAKEIGFKKHDIPILMKARLLKPLGNPPRNGVKHFAACQVGKLACDDSLSLAPARLIIWIAII